MPVSYDREAVRKSLCEKIRRAAAKVKIFLFCIVPTNHMMFILLFLTHTIPPIVLSPSVYTF